MNNRFAIKEYTKIPNFYHPRDRKQTNDLPRIIHFQFMISNVCLKMILKKEYECQS